MDARRLLLESFRAAVAAADPAEIVAAHLPDADTLRGFRKTLVVGAGKAGGSMAHALEAAWPEDLPLEGLVVTRYGHAMPTRRIRVVEAGHPVPDAAGEAAAAEILERVRGLSSDDFLIVLISGGGSSLLNLPVAAVPGDDIRAVTRALLASGAPIEEINVVRKHLSQVKGGRLAQASRAPVLALIVSDVAGDDVSAIASGPCAPDPSSYADALQVLARWQVAVPDRVRSHLEHGRDGAIDETPKPGDPLFERVENRLIATAHGSLEAACGCFESAGVTAVILGDTVTGEARDVAQVMAALVREIRSHGKPFVPPVALISGGECTVTVRGQGRGGRCQEFVLALAVALGPNEDVWALAADTDGIDGSSDAAGALLAPDAHARAAEAGLVPRAALDDNDGHGFFEALGDLVRTGPTRTNVNDYRVILVLPQN